MPIIVSIIKQLLGEAGHEERVYSDEVIREVFLKMDIDPERYEDSSNPQSEQLTPGIRVEVRIAVDRESPDNALFEEWYDIRQVDWQAGLKEGLTRHLTRVESPFRIHDSTLIDQIVAKALAFSSHA